MPIPATPEFRSWLDDNLKNWLKVARLNMLKGEAHVPLMMVFSKDDELAIMPVPIGSNDQKDMVAFLHKNVAASPIVKAAVLVIETWTLAKPADEGRKMDMSKSIENHPDRREALMFNCIMSGMQLMALCRINRKDPAFFDETIIIDPTNPSSPMIGRFVLEPSTKQ